MNDILELIETHPLEVVLCLAAIRGAKLDKGDPSASSANTVRPRMRVLEATFAAAIVLSTPGCIGDPYDMGQDVREWFSPPDVVNRTPSEHDRVMVIRPPAHPVFVDGGQR